MEIPQKTRTKTTIWPRHPNCWDICWVYMLRKIAIQKDTFHSFTSGWPVFPAPLVKEIVFTPLYILASFVKDKVSVCVDLSLGFLFCSIDLYVCLCASTILFWWLWLCSKAWSQASWFLQFHSYFSRLLWQFEVFLYFHTNCEIFQQTKAQVLTASQLNSTKNFEKS